MHVLVSGPQGRRNQVRSALKTAGFTFIDEEDHGFPRGHEVEWTGARYKSADIAELDDTNPGHGKIEGDLVPETGEFVTKEVRHAVCFICVEREDARAMDDVQPIVDEHGWQLRAHWVKPPDPPMPAIADILPRLGIDPQALREFLGVK